MNEPRKKFDSSYLDNDERRLAEALERGELDRSSDFKQRKKELEQAAKNSIKRRAINIRLPERDLGRIKTLARRDGIPYQTLISSIVHRYAEGTLKRDD